MAKKTKRSHAKDPRATGATVGAAAYKKLRTFRAPRIKARVTDQLVAEAIVGNSGWCMVSEAVKAAAPWATHVSSDLQTIRISDPRKGLRYVYLTPRSAQDALIRFDQGEKPRPFEFKLGGAYIHTSYKKPVDGGKAKALHKLGRRRLLPAHPSKRLVPDVIGGDPPKRAAPLGTYRREFGLRAYVGGFNKKVPVGGPSISDK